MSQISQRRKYAKKQLVNRYKLHETDTGSTIVKIAVKSEQILGLAKHLSSHKNDKVVERRLDQLVAERKKLIRYAHHNSEQKTPQYQNLIEEFHLKS